MSKLEFFSKERIIYKEEVMTIRDFYYRTLIYDYSEYFEIGYIKGGLSYNNNIIPIGTNYRSVNLKDINVPKKKEIDLSKMISLIKNNSSLSNELDKYTQRVELVFFIIARWLKHNVFHRIWI